MSERSHQYYLKNKNMPAFVYNRYKVGARRRHLIFHISYQDFLFFLWNKPCHYCNDKLIKIGIDRVDSSKGYHIGNVVPCCGTCNYMKSSLPREVFLNQCKKIASHF